MPVTTEQLVAHKIVEDNRLATFVWGLAVDCRQKAGVLVTHENDPVKARRFERMAEELEACCTKLRELGGEAPMFRVVDNG